MAVCKSQAGIASLCPKEAAEALLCLSPLSHELGRVSDIFCCALQIQAKALYTQLVFISLTKKGTL